MHVLLYIPTNSKCEAYIAPHLTCGVFGTASCLNFWYSSGYVFIGYSFILPFPNDIEHLENFYFQSAYLTWLNVQIVHPFLRLGCLFLYYYVCVYVCILYQNCDLQIISLACILFCILLISSRREIVHFDDIQFIHFSFINHILINNIYLRNLCPKLTKIFSAIFF